MNEFVVLKSDEGKRIDNYLMEKMEISRSKVQTMIENKQVFVNDKETKNSYKIKENDIVKSEEYVEEELQAVPENIPLDIVYEDDDVIVVNKRNGMVVHPAVGNTKGTLVNALLYHFKNLSDINGTLRPGIVHRIDAYTTGLLMVAKNNKAHTILAHELEEKKTTRKYIALVWGIVNTDTGTIDAPIGRDLNDRKKMAVTDINAKNAVTHFKVLERYKDTTLIELSLETGRTHQIRVHMNYIGYPVVNDPVYGNKKSTSFGQMLHAETIGFIHPTTKKYMEFSVKPPKEFEEILEKYKNE